MRNVPTGSAVLEDRAAAIGFLFLLGTKVHFAYDLGEDLVDVGAILGAGLDEGATPGLRELIALWDTDLALVLQIDLVGDEQDRHAFRSLNSGDELLHGADVLERLVIGQTVYDYEPLAVLDVKVAHAGELFGSGCV